MNVGEILSQAGLGSPVAGFLALLASLVLGIAIALVVVFMSAGRRGCEPGRQPEPQPRGEAGPPSPPPGQRVQGGILVKGGMMLPATAYQALRDLSGCRGVLVVESGRVLCVTSDEEAVVVWPREGGEAGGGPAG